LAQITINHVPGVATRLVPLDSFGVPNAIDHPGIVCNTLQAIIDSKETKLPQYRQKCDEAWLVIYTGHSPSSRIDMAFGLGDCQFATQFDKVLLYDQDQEINQVFTLA